jgi:hypothetical protein
MLFNLALEFILGRLSTETKLLLPSQKADKWIHSTPLMGETLEAVKTYVYWGQIKVQMPASNTVYFSLLLIMRLRQR